MLVTQTKCVLNNKYLMYHVLSRLAIIQFILQTINLATIRSMDGTFNVVIWSLTFCILTSIYYVLYEFVNGSRENP